MVLPVRAKRTSDSLEPFAGHLAAKPRCGSTERCNTAPDHGASLGIALAQKPGLIRLMLREAVRGLPNR